MKAFLLTIIIATINVAIATCYVYFPDQRAVMSAGAIMVLGFALIWGMIHAMDEEKRL